MRGRNGLDGRISKFGVFSNLICKWFHGIVLGVPGKQKRYHKRCTRVSSSRSKVAAFVIK